MCRDASPSQRDQADPVKPSLDVVLHHPLLQQLPTFCCTLMRWLLVPKASLIRKLNIPSWSLLVTINIESAVANGSLANAMATWFCGISQAQAEAKCRAKCLAPGRPLGRQNRKGESKAREGYKAGEREQTTRHLCTDWQQPSPRLKIEVSFWALSIGENHTPTTDHPTFWAIRPYICKRFQRLLLCCICCIPAIRISTKMKCSAPGRRSASSTQLHPLKANSRWPPEATDWRIKHSL